MTNAQMEPTFQEVAQDCSLGLGECVSIPLRWHCTYRECWTESNHIKSSLVLPFGTTTNLKTLHRVGKLYEPLKVPRAHRNATARKHAWPHSAMKTRTNRLDRRNFTLCLKMGMYFLSCHSMTHKKHSYGKGRYHANIELPRKPHKRLLQIHIHELSGGQPKSHTLSQIGSQTWPRSIKAQRVCCTPRSGKCCTPVCSWI
jgi:hypothetical protein